MSFKAFLASIFSSILLVEVKGVRFGGALTPIILQTKCFILITALLVVLNLLEKIITTSGLMHNRTLRQKAA
jgi:hypothetical protein